MSVLNYITLAPTRHKKLVRLRLVRIGSQADLISLGHPNIEKHALTFPYDSLVGQGKYLATVTPSSYSHKRYSDQQYIQSESIIVVIIITLNAMVLKYLVMLEPQVNLRIFLFTFTFA